MSAAKLPPTRRTPIWQCVNEHAESGKFKLPVCSNCAAVQYPPREICKDCLHDDLAWQEVSPKGRVLSSTLLNASTNAFFREHLPLRVVLVKLDCGEILFTHAANISFNTGDSVQVLCRKDRGKNAVFISVLDSLDEKEQLDQLREILNPGK